MGSYKIEAVAINLLGWKFSGKGETQESSKNEEKGWVTLFYDEGDRGKPVAEWIVTKKGEDVMEETCNWSNWL